MPTRKLVPAALRPARPLLHLPERDWPPADLERFADTFDQQHDVFADQSNGSHLKPRTRTAIRYGYRRWLGWLAAVEPDLLSADPPSRATPDRVRAYVVHLRQTCRERAISSQVRLLHDALRYMYAGHDWSWLREISARLERAIPKTGRKPILLTSQVLTDTSLARLDEIDAEFAASAARSSRKHVQKLALRYRDALLVALASFLPIRRSNLAELRIGSTLRRGPSVWTVCIPGDHVKNEEPVDADLPDWISERVDRFVDVYRPLIYRSSSHNGLWASAKGCPATGDALYNAFQKEVSASLAIHLSLHDTRRIAVTTWAIHDPVNAAGAKDLLGERSDRVIAEHYNLASGIEASREMARILASLKE